MIGGQYTGKLRDIHTYIRLEYNFRLLLSVGWKGDGINLCHHSAEHQITTVALDRYLFM